MNPESLVGLGKSKYEYLIKDCEAVFPMSLHKVEKYRNVGQKSIDAFIEAGLIHYDAEDKQLAKERIDYWKTVESKSMRWVEKARRQIDKWSSVSSHTP